MEKLKRAEKAGAHGGKAQKRRRKGKGGESAKSQISVDFCPKLSISVPFVKKVRISVEVLVFTHARLIC